MRKMVIALAAAALTATSAFAGGLDEPEVEEVVEIAVIEEESGSSGGIVIPLLLLAVFAAVAISD